MNHLTLMTFFYFKEDGREKLQEFQEKARPIFQKYGLFVEKEFTPSGQGHIGPVENTIERPDLIQVVSLQNPEMFQAYLADEELKLLAPIRASGLRKMTACFGPRIEIGEAPGLRQPGALNFAALVNFKTNGDSSGIEEFNRRGLNSGLFMRYGIRVLNMARVSKAITPIGTSDFEQPEMVLHFSVEDPKVLMDYMADPQYIDLAPLRDAGLKSYLFFTGV